MTVRLSVVVATYQRCELLRRCLAGLAEQTLPAEDYEVVVVDDGSEDGTAELLQSWSRAAPRRVVVRQGANGGAAAARNVGVRTAAGPVVAFTDDDCVPDPHWLEAGLSAIERGDVAVVQGATLADPAEPLGRWPKTQVIGAFTGLFETCNIFYRRDALMAAGGFDEGLRWFGEDTTAGWRVIRAGGRATFAPEATVIHAVTHPGFAAFLRQARHYRNWPALVRRCPEMRDSTLWHRWFLRPRSAEALALVAGSALAVAGLASGRVGLVVPGAALVAPAVRHRAPRTLDRSAWVDAALATVFDLAVEAALIEGSLRARSVVL